MKTTIKQQKKGFAAMANAAVCRPVFAVQFSKQHHFHLA
ncbi:MAG: hypothetical protein K0R66_532 [Gammaproteobacteria bacterium]|jgi:hypothetical protein|nr:hypothetical protein [Gammaproteobacteria bacterium]